MAQLRLDKTVRFRLDLAKDEEAHIFRWLEEQKQPRRGPRSDKLGVKNVLMLGVRLAAAALTKDYDELAVLLPGFVQHIQQQVQSPANAAFEGYVQPRQDAPEPEPEPEPVAVLEDPFDDLDSLGL